MENQLTKEEISQYEKLSHFKIDLEHSNKVKGKYKTYLIKFANGKSCTKSADSIRKSIDFILNKDPQYKIKKVYQAEQLFFDYTEDNWSKDYKMYATKINKQEASILEQIAKSRNTTVFKLIKGYLKALIRSKDKILSSKNGNN